MINLTLFFIGLNSQLFCYVLPPPNINLNAENYNTYFFVLQLSTYHYLCTPKLVNNSIA